jgi:hypothetical protein
MRIDDGSAGFSTRISRRRYAAWRCSVSPRSPEAASNKHKRNEALTFNQRVIGSNPIALTNKIKSLDQKLNGEAMMFSPGLGGRVTGHGGIKNELALQVTDLIAGFAPHPTQ